MASPNSSIRTSPPSTRSSSSSGESASTAQEIMSFAGNRLDPLHAHSRDDPSSSPPSSPEAPHDPLASSASTLEIVNDSLSPSASTLEIVNDSLSPSASTLEIVNDSLSPSSPPLEIEATSSQQTSESDSSLGSLDYSIAHWILGYSPSSKRFKRKRSESVDSLISDPRPLRPRTLNHSCKPAGSSVSATTHAEISGRASPSNSQPPRTLDLATAVVLHNWCETLDGQHPDAWLLRWVPSGPQPCSDETIGSTFEMYRDYKKAYPSYDVPIRDFLVASLYLYYTHVGPQQVAAEDSKTPGTIYTKPDRHLHSYLWDDFIRCLTTEFPQYIRSCEASGKVAMHAGHYYNDRVLKPSFCKMVLSDSSLHSFVSGEAVSWINTIFTHETTKLLVGIIGAQHTENDSLTAAILSHKSIDRQLAVLTAHKLKRKKEEDYFKARCAGKECSRVDAPCPKPAYCTSGREASA